MVRFDNLSGSFRDPSGIVFYKDGEVYRQVNFYYKKHYIQLMESGLYGNLIKDELLIPHEEVVLDKTLNEYIYKIIKPEFIEFISYPYEWCFSQLKDSALTMLKIQKKALEFGMSLKDGSAYNIQFKGGKPVLIDTLSFEGYKENLPWIGYRQFCQHFIAPLSLMSFRDIRLNQLLRVYVDGIPLDLTSKLLNWRSYFKLGLLFHIHLHAKSQKIFGTKPIEIKNKSMNKYKMLSIIENLESLVRSLQWKPKKSEWSNYYDESIYSPNGFEYKKQIIDSFFKKINSEWVWDLGSNTGLFSRIASAHGNKTLSWDVDPAAVEINYLKMKEKKENTILPLLLDLTNPSPSIGWLNQERTSLFERKNADTVLALALVHHLAISNNVPLNMLAQLFKEICKWLIIEFVPKNDPQSIKLLRNREDIFMDYNQNEFEKNFREDFQIIEQTQIIDTERIIYLMKNKER